MYYVTGSWIVPRNGSGGMDGQFVSEEEAKTFVQAQQFDNATLRDDGSHLASYADGKWRSTKTTAPGPTEFK